MNILADKVHKQVVCNAGYCNNYTDAESIKIVLVLSLLLSPLIEVEVEKCQPINV